MSGKKRIKQNNAITVAVTLVTVIIIVLIAALTLSLPEVRSEIKNSLDMIFDAPAKEIIPENSSFETTIEITGDYSEAAGKTLTAYFRLFYGMIGSGKEEDIERVYGHDREDSLYDAAVMKCMSKAAAKGSVFKSCKVSLHVTSSYDDEKIAEVQLTETVAIDYGEFSAEAGQISQVFTFTPSGGEYLIKTHKCSSDFYDMLKKAVSAEADASGHRINELTYSYLEKYIDTAVEKLSGRIQENEQENEVPAAKPEFEYDRNAAVHYANSWASTAAEVRNRSMYGVYEENSMNYISQCLIAGGIPMDTQGDDASTQWKWYGENINYERGVKGGCTESFFNGSAFYEYCISNKGFGICTRQITPEEAEPGDIVQFISGGEITETGIITAVYESDNTNTLLINKNTTDMICMPTELFPCEEIRIIKVLGYNTVSELMPDQEVSE